MKALALKAIIVYQRCVSPLIPPSCRYYPSCSHYTHEAIQRWGLFHGFWLGVGRVLRCNPWATGGMDPVPRQNRQGR